MGHGQGRDKGHEQGKGKEKGEGKGKSKEGQGQGQEKGEGESFQGQEQAENKPKSKAMPKRRYSSEGKGLSPSPGAGGGEEAKGDEKGQKAKGEGKAPKTPEEVKRHSKQRREKRTMTDRANAAFDKQGYRVPYYHRRKRVPPGTLRKITDKLVPTWKKKRRGEGELFSQSKSTHFITSREGYESYFQQQVKKMRKEIKAVFHTSSLTPVSSRTSPARGPTSFAKRHYGKVG